jgi:methyltransferase (TIGR00027 family)
MTMKAVSYTAQWTAAARAVETERQDERLVIDEFARAMAEPDGFTLLDKYSGGGVQDFVAIRTRYFDDSITGLLDTTDIKQVVLIACGMDMRCFRLKWPTDVVVYEVDHAALHDEKQRRLKALDAEPAVDRRAVRADLAEDWLPSLTLAGFDPTQPALWVPEGLFFFLTEEQSAGLLRTLAQASTPGSWLAVDVLSERLLRSPATQMFLAALRADGTPWLFGTDNPASFLAAHGWELRELHEPGDPGAGQGRWPYQSQPRSVHGVPRNWLIRAEVLPPS